MAEYQPPHIKPENKGKLHRAMGKLSEGTKLNLGAIMREKSKAKKEGNTTLEREAQFAINARKWHHGKAA